MKPFLVTAAMAAAFALSPMVAMPANAAVQVYLFDVTGILSVDGASDPDNEVFAINIGPSAEVTGIGWDVTLFAGSPSYLSQMVVSYGTSSANPFSLTVGFGSDLPGTESYSSGGIIDLVGIGLNFNVDGDGLLRLEFFEDFDDFLNEYDGIWQSGTLSIQVGRVPEPATWGMMIAGFGLVGFAARRRRGMVAQA